MADGARIGVVTVTYNSARVISGFMQSVLAQTEGSFILYIIDNDSADDTVKLLSNYSDPRIRLIKNAGNVGVAAGNNQGIRASIEDRCGSVLLINNDTEFEPALFAKLVEGLDRYQCDMIVPKITYHDSDKIWCAGGRFNRWLAYATVHDGEGQRDGGQFDVSRQIEYAPTCCMLIKNRVFETVGLMDEKYFVYYDDADFCLRANRLGVKLWYMHEAQLSHKTGSLTGGEFSPFGVRYGTRNKVYFVRKHTPVMAVPFWLSAYQLLFAARLLSRKDKFSTFLMRQKAFAEGLSL